jgi:O-antigen ligase
MKKVFNYDTLISFGVFIFFALSLSVPSGYSYGAALLFLTSAVFLYQRWSGLRLSLEDKVIACAMLSIFLVSVLAYVLQDNELKTLDQTSRCLLAIPILLVLLKHPPRLGALWGGVIAAGISASAVAAWQYYVLDVSRPTGYMTSAIPFGDISLMAGILCALAIPWGVKQGRFAAHWCSALVLGFGGGLYASILSGSRGGWLAVPAVVLLTCVCFANRHNYKRILAGLGAAIAITIALFNMPNSGLKYRYDLAVYQATQYFHQNDAIGTSVGVRLEAWRAALVSIPKKPLIGWGYADYQTELERMADGGEIYSYIPKLANTHSNYLEVWLHQGTLGLLALLALYILPFAYFCRRFRSQDRIVKVLALCGASLLSSFFIFGLTQVILGRNNGIVFFLLTLIVLWASMRDQERNHTAALRN